MNIIITKNYQELSRKAAAFFLNQLALKPNSVFGLATGSTPLGMYQEIIRNTKDYTYNFSSAKTFNLDEYYGLGARHPQSYHFYLTQNFFRHVNLKQKNIHLLDGMIKNVKDHCAWYEALVKKNPLDLLILGIGENGHIGFNEPGSSPASTTRLIKLVEDTIRTNARFFKNERVVPRQALTMGIKTILQAKKILLLASGPQKADAIKKMIEGPITSGCPASFLKYHPDVTVIVDSAAAAHLQDNYRLRISGWGEVKLLNETVMPKNKKILIISPHPDDSVVSCGATIKTLSRHNKIHTLVMSPGWRGVLGKKSIKDKTDLRRREALKEAKILNSRPVFGRFYFYDQQQKFWQEDLKTLAHFWQKIQPEIVVLPHTYDEHPTHILSTELILDFFKLKKVKNVELWYYEGLWSQHILDQINLVFSFSKKLLILKNKAIRMHRSQTVRLPMIKASRGLAEFRAKTIPEQLFVGHGGLSPNLGDYVEAYYTIKY